MPPVEAVPMFPCGRDGTRARGVDGGRSGGGGGQIGRAAELGHEGEREADRPQGTTCHTCRLIGLPKIDEGHRDQCCSPADRTDTESGPCPRLECHGSILGDDKGSGAGLRNSIRAKAFVVLVGTQASIPRSAFGKRKRYDMNIQVLIDLLGRLLWTPSALPESTHGRTVARHHGIIEALAGTGAEVPTISLISCIQELRPLGISAG